MVDLNNFKISVFPGVNDQMISASPTEGCNGGFITAAINNLIDEVNLLKTIPGGSSSSFNFSYDDIAESETTTFTIILSAPFDFYIVNVHIDNPSPFINLYLVVSGQQRPLIPTTDSNLFTVDPSFVGTGYRVDLVMIASPEAVAAGLEEDVAATLIASFSPLA